MSGRVALVTGGGGGMGSAIAERLAADGHTVAVADLRLDTAVEAAARVTDAGGV
ncbi:SDR family NAD(P)-dependent oxidoreductase, partial [Mycobacterium sp.]|uniref:SDR family NAD(P)-dependent oxidoreductase n=1 Tax=Mycobacterium sp. TaxID=1785 RepID=UPI0039C91E33